MPWMMAGKCYATPAEANQAFASQFPKLGDVNYTSWVSSSVSSGGVLTYSLSTRPITSNTLASRTGTMQLSSCTEPDPEPTEFDPAAAAGLWAFFFCFVMVLYLVARSSGAILEALRKF